MDLIEILAIVIIALLLVAITLLVILLLRKPRVGSADPTAITETVEQGLSRTLTDTLRRDVTDPILRAERESQSTLRTEMQSELRGSRTELGTTVQTSMEKLGQSLRESQKDTADLQAKESLLQLEAKAYILAHNSTESSITDLVHKNLDNMYGKLSMVEEQADSWMTMEVLAAKVMAHTGADLENTAKVLGMQRNIQVLMNHLLETGRLTHRVRDGYIEYCRA
jgi:ribosome-binding ATPase YchF (GTP1/OBG family)